MSVRDISVAWLPSGLKPSADYSGGEFDRNWYESLTDAVDDAVSKRRSYAENGYEPWLSATTKNGTEVLSFAGICLLHFAYAEGLIAKGT